MKKLFFEFHRDERFENKGQYAFITISSCLLFSFAVSFLLQKLRILNILSMSLPKKVYMNEMESYIPSTFK